MTKEAFNAAIKSLSECFNCMVNKEEYTTHEFTIRTESILTMSNRLCSEDEFSEIYGIYKNLKAILRDINVLKTHLF